MVDEPFLLLHGIQDRYNALYKDNIEVLDKADVPIASIGGSGQTYLGNLLIEAGANYADPYIERLGADGSSTPEPAYDEYRNHLSGALQKSMQLSYLSSPFTSVRFFKTHLEPAFFVDTSVEGVWLLIRDPRDSLYSWFNFRRNFAKDPLDLLAADFTEWLQRPGPTGKNRLDDWADFYTHWETMAQNLSSVAISRFEDLKLGPVDELMFGLSRFGIEVDRDRLTAAVQKSEFDNMASHERKNGGLSSARIMRKGQPYEWKTWMTPATQKLFSEHRITDVAYTFGYAV
ncbi:sulfotransferase domain-containing protein [Rothia koreensis]|uniref:sulfotransferase domain-containing protein n=1 Tax=Rothia koreensis TaxID=592378 RepID=UPI0037C6F716